MLNLHRDKKNVRREPGRDGKILCDHRQDGNDEVHRLYVRLKGEKKKNKNYITKDKMHMKYWNIVCVVLL